MPTPKRYYVTTPIYYVNDVPHIGHAYTTLACDVLARFKRLDGYEVMFLTGTDEHGQKVEKSAAAAGLAPQEFCDRVSERFRALLRTMNFSADRFIRTTEPDHIRSAQELWRRIEANGHIYEGSYAGWYSVRDEAFYAESELIEGEGGQKCAPTGAPVEWVEEPSFFFRLSDWQQPLLDFYDRHPDFVLPQARMNEVRSFVAGGLRDLSISRTSFHWGVPVPDHPGHIMYVWIDALTNYITGVGFPDTASDAFRTFWPADVHMVGKDILRFHAVYWPAFLMAAGLEPPRRVFAHGWWTNEGQKISKSLGNIIDPFALVETYGLDPVRYFLMREVPFGQDGDFSRAAFITRANADLANDFGNLAQRTLSMIAKNCGGQVPRPGAFKEADQALLDGIDATLALMRAHLDVQAIHLALEALWKQVAAANAYVAAMAPWALRKSDPERMATVLYVAAEAVRKLGILAQPVTPDAMASLLDQLAVPQQARDFAHLGTRGRLAPGTSLPPPQGVFPRLKLEEERA
ncbi:MAG: methionine--tRNA ligase [Rhodothalassiaceae bacterium]